MNRKEAQGQVGAAGGHRERKEPAPTQQVRTMRSMSTRATTAQQATQSLQPESDRAVRDTQPQSGQGSRTKTYLVHARRVNRLRCTRRKKKRKITATMHQPAEACPAPRGRDRRRRVSQTLMLLVFRQEKGTTSTSASSISQRHSTQQHVTQRTSPTESVTMNKIVNQYETPSDIQNGDKPEMVAPTRIMVYESTRRVRSPTIGTRKIMRKGLIE